MAALPPRAVAAQDRLADAGREQVPFEDPSGSPLLRDRIEELGAARAPAVLGERLWSARSVEAFYRDRDYAPAWLVNGRPGADAHELLAALESAGDDGLRPGEYHLERLRTLLGPPPTSEPVKGPPEEPEEWIDLEILLSDAFFLLASHLLDGRVDPRAVLGEWDGPRATADLAATLEEVLAGAGVGAALDALRPRHPAYDRLRWALEQLRDVEARGGWPTIPGSERLEAGDHGPRVLALRRRLQAEFDLPDIMIEGNPFGDLERFDDLLVEGVMAFQERHGLFPDGVVGARTLQALNTPVEDRIRQVEVNLERWRWLPRDLGSRYVLVNIPNYSADVIEDGRTVLRMKAIVGQPFRQTPVFSGRMTYLVFSPFWNVPETIAMEDKYPELVVDPGWATEHHYRLFPMHGTEELDPYSLPWDTLTAEGFAVHYRLRQDPGPWNALGTVKFMFPNEYDVYLHDTNERYLFERSGRSLSSGCIRIDQPVTLAEYLLSSDSTWTRERILDEMDEEEPRTVGLPEPIPVHLLYWTSFVDDSGDVHFRDDLYQRDRPIARALARAPLVR